MGEIYGQYFFNGSNRVKSEGFDGWNVFVLFFVCYSPSLPLSRIAFIGQTWRMKRYTAPTGWRDTMSQRWRSTSTTPSTWWCSMNRGSPKVRHAGLWYDTDLFYFSGDIVKDRAATVNWLDEDVQVTGLHCKSGIMGSDHGCSVYQSGIMTCQCCRQTMTKKQYCTPWQQSLESSMFRPKDSLIKTVLDNND